MDRVMEVWRLWDGIAREGNKHSVYVGNLGGGIRVVKDLWRIGQGAGWFNADHQGRSGDTPIWDCAQQGRVAWSVMPNAAYLSEETCRQIRDYAAAGGSVLATFETSRYDEWGDRRTEPALADLFGVTTAGDVVGPTANSYMRLERAHPVGRGFDGTALLPGPENRLPIRARGDGSPILTVVPYYPAFPPEMVFPRTPRTDEPAAVFHESGRSRRAYFAGDVDRTFWRSGSPDLGQLLASVRWVLGDAPRPATNMTRPFVRRFYPIGPLRVGFEVPTGRTVARVQALRSGRALAFKQEGRTVRFELQSVVDYEVVALT